MFHNSLGNYLRSIVRLHLVPAICQDILLDSLGKLLHRLTTKKALLLELCNQSFRLGRIHPNGKLHDIAVDGEAVVTAKRHEAVAQMLKSVDKCWVDVVLRGLFWRDHLFLAVGNLERHDCGVTLGAAGSSKFAFIARRLLRCCN